MTRLLRGNGPFRRLFLACVAFTFCPLNANAAGWLGLRNDLSTPVVVQSSTVVNNAVRPGKPRLLYPGEVAWDGILQPGNKIIAVYDAKRRTLLYKNQVRCAGNDLFFSLRPDAAARTPVTLAPAKMPMAPGSRPPSGQPSSGQIPVKGPGR